MTLCIKLMEAARKVGFIVNDRKTEYMKHKRRYTVIFHGKSIVVEDHNMIF